MVATESVPLTCIVDVEEERDVAVIDIPNAFIQTVGVRDKQTKDRHSKISDVQKS